MRALLGVLLSTTLLVAIPGFVAVVWGQSPSPSETLPSPLRKLERNLPDLGTLLNNDAPSFDRETVRLDGRSLFTIASPKSTDTTNRSNNGSTRIQSRATTIEKRLSTIVREGFDPGSLNVTSEMDSTSNQPVIYANYSRDGESQQTELLTVTFADAQVNSSTPKAWANEIKPTIENALINAQQERQPASLRRSGLIGAAILLGMGLVSLYGTYLRKRLRKERKTLSVQQAQNEQIPDEPDGELPRVTTALLQQKIANRQQRNLNEIKRRLLQLAQIGIWCGGLFAIIGLFPYTRWLQPTILGLLVGSLKIPLMLIAIAIGTYVAIRLSDVLIDRLLLALQQSASLAPSTSQRLALRFSTFSSVSKGVIAVLLSAIGFIAALSVVGFQVGPLIAGAGIIGLGISLASQNLIKDIINGFLILLEDQYGVGDVIMVGDVAGLVETMNLRITQLRNEEGRLITIPNSAISIVQNLSKEWSRVDLSISVAYNTDLDRALAVIDQVAIEMSHDPDWKSLILEQPQLLGVDKLDYAGATIRLWIKTQPLKQWDVAREYRRRLKRAFDQAGIPIGIPQQSLWLSNAPELGNELKADIRNVLQAANRKTDSQPYNHSRSNPTQPPDAADRK
jgi:small conductance mechanosensitive channel